MCILGCFWKTVLGGLLILSSLRPNRAYRYSSISQIVPEPCHTLRARSTAEEQTDTAHVRIGDQRPGHRDNRKQEIERMGVTLNRQCTSLHSLQHVAGHTAGAWTGICVWSGCGVYRKNTLLGEFSTESSMLWLLERGENVALVGPEFCFLL